MIKSLYIKDYAIIEELNIDFKNGLNIFLGETGSGKSIIIGAIDLLRGGRGDTSLIRKGADKALLEASFELNDHFKKTLADAEIDYDDELIVSRTIGEKSTIRVNGRMVTLNFLRELFDEEIDIHSQKDSQYLFKTANHLKLLDTFLNDDDLLSAVNESYKRYASLKKSYEDFLNNTPNSDDIDYFRFQIAEIDKAALDPLEEEELLKLEKKIKNYEREYNHLHNALAYYNEEKGIKESLYQAIRELEGLDDEAELLEKLYNHHYELEDLFGKIEDQLASLDLSEERIDEIQDRLFEINKLKRKYHTDIEGILRYKDELLEKIKAFDERETYLAEFESKVEAALNSYMKEADLLSKKRKETALKLKEAIIKEVSDLELKYFDFAVVFKRSELSASGYDDVIFMISTNKGEELKPLNKVASGGETSRILLGLKSIFSRLMKISLAIFDEIDTGISGKAAGAVGLKMAKISQDMQVLAITHSPAVAAYGDHFYEVVKETFSDKTTTSIIPLAKDKTVEVLAVMIASDISDNSLLMAKELLNKAQSIKDEYADK